MPETPETWRTFAALLELHRDEEFPFSTKRIATQSGVTIGATERELERLARVDAVDGHDAEGEEYELTGLPVEETASRLDTLAALTDDEYDALTDALERGDVDPADVLYDVGDAREAAQRALGEQMEAD